MSGLKLAAAAVVVLYPHARVAEILKFSFTGDSGDFATWTQPSDPTSVGFEDQFYTDVQVTNGTSNRSSFTIVEFDSNDVSNGGFFIDEVTFSAPDLPYTASQSTRRLSRRRFPREHSIFDRHRRGSRTLDLGDDADGFAVSATRAASLAQGAASPPDLLSLT